MFTRTCDGCDKKIDLDSEGKTMTIRLGFEPPLWDIDLCNNCAENLIMWIKKWFE